MRGEFLHPQLSPDGGRVSALHRKGGPLDVWVFDLERQIGQPITFTGNTPAPLWHPDGKRVTFGSNQILQKSADGTGEPEVLFDDTRDNWPMSWMPDGSVLAFERRTADSGMDIWTLTTGTESKVGPLMSTPFNEESARFSPNGDVLAYLSDHTGRYEVYLTRYPSLQGRVQVSVDGGSAPVWVADGSEIFYRLEDRFFSVEISQGVELQVGEPKFLFEGPYNRGETHAHYDFDSVGDRFILVQEDRETYSTVRIVLHWQQEIVGLFGANH
jgi:Tol biopolymer transport system component